MKGISGFLQKNQALGYKEFLSYLSIRFGLIFALSMQFTIVTYHIYHITGQSKLALGLVGLAEVIPVVACSFFAGYFVDLNEKRNLLRKIIGLYALLGLSLYLLFNDNIASFLSHDWRIYGIYILIFLGGIIRSFLGPTSFSLIGLIVPRTLYPNATSWASIAWQIGAVLGPLFGGVLIASTGVDNGILIVFIIEIILLYPISRIKQKPVIKAEKKENVIASIQEGLKFVFNTPALLGALCLDMFSVLFGGAVALLPAVQLEIFPDNGTLFSGASAFGILRAAPGIGALLTLGLLSFFPLKNQPGRKLFICVAGFGICIVGFGLSKYFILSWLFLVGSGMFDAVSVVIRGTILQLVTPDDMRGRVSSVNTMFISSSNELGDFESGLMAKFIGTVPAIVLGGSITLIVVALTYIKTPQLRKFNFDDYTKK